MDGTVEKSVRNYDKLIYEFEPQYTEWGDWCYSPQAYFRGEENIPGSRYNVGFQIFQAPFFLEREPHFHREEEYLIFLGADLFHPFDFQAEIELWLGEYVDKMERYVITRPAVVRIPSSYWHCPLDFKRIDKPILFQAAYLDGTCGRVTRRIGEGGEVKYEYGGPETTGGCRLEPGKRCTACGKCFRLQWEKEDGRKYKTGT